MILSILFMLVLMTPGQQHVPCEQQAAKMQEKEKPKYKDEIIEGIVHRTEQRMGTVVYHTMENGKMVPHAMQMELDFPIDTEEPPLATPKQHIRAAVRNCIARLDSQLERVRKLRRR